MKDWAWVILVITGVSLVTCTVQFVRDQAKQEALKEIEDANQKAEGRAREAQSAVDRCYHNGGTWNRSVGVCNEPSGQ